MLNLCARRHGAAAALLALMLTACGSKPAQPQMPPVVVETETLRTQSLPNVIELPGRITAVRTAEVRARTDGIVERRLYHEGTDVAAGTPLFQIDPRDYRAQVEQARAALQRAEAARANARAVVTRYQPLVADRAVSGQEYDAALSTLRQADASVADARASLSRAELLLSHTTVRAPIAGRVGRAEVTEGALVSGASATLMTRIDQMNPVYAVFTQSSAAVMDMLRQARRGQLTLPSELGRVDVRLITEDGELYGLVGHLDFADQSVDPSTGSQTLRAIFPNPQRMLLPGQFVRVRLEAGRITDGIAVPQRAVQISNGNGSVFTVNADGKAVARPVKLGSMAGDRWVVLSGLSAGERVVVEGWQKLQPGMPVQVKGDKPAAASPTAAPAAVSPTAAPAAAAKAR